MSTYGNLQNDKSQRQAIQAILNGEVASGGPNKVNAGETDHNITDMWRGTQAEYDALESYSETTLYVIVG